MFLQCSRGRVIVFCATLSFIPLADGLAAQVEDQSNTLVVHVTDDTGGPLTSQVRVELLEGGQAMRAGFPDSRGSYRFTGLVGGFYTARASHPGYETASQTVSVSSGLVEPRQRRR